MQIGLREPFQLGCGMIPAFHRVLIAFSLVNTSISVHKICGWAVCNVVHQCSMIRWPALCSSLPKFWAAKSSTS